MADNNSSNVATVAIVILVLVALVGGYYFMKDRKMDAPNESTTKVELNVPQEDKSGAAK